MLGLTVDEKGSKKKKNTNLNASNTIVENIGSPI